jgi:Na+/melibiose symporter-like transporter
MTRTPTEPNTSSRLGFKEKLGYGLGDTASHFVWDMVGFWLLFFYTDVYGIGAKAAGTIMLIARFWDMASDPLMGIISDRTRTRWGKFRPYILFCARDLCIADDCIHSHQPALFLPVGRDDLGQL